MAGSAQQAMTGVKLGVEVLTKALAGLPPGSEVHTEVLKAISNISKHIGQDGGDSGANVQMLAQLARQQSQAPQQAAMMRAFPQPQGGAPPPQPGA